MPSSQRSFTRFAWLVIAFTIAVVLWGAYVRATGSGAGCGSHWPLCNGEVIPRAESIETVIEFSHRVSSGIAFLLVLGLLIWAFRMFQKGHRVRKAAAWSLFFMVTEALVGAGLVLFGLVGEDSSLTRAWVMAFHLVNTFLLLGALSLTAWWGAGRPAPERPAPVRDLVLVLLVLGGLLLVGMSGAVAALGDTLFPAVGGLADSIALDFDPESHILIRLRVYHPALAVAFALIALTAVFSLNDSSRGRELRKLGQATGSLVIVQMVVGAVNLILLAPVWLQMVHLLVADLLWISAVLFSCAALSHRTSNRDMTA